MKKIALAAFSATALLALSACGGEAPAPEATDTAVVVEETPVVVDTAVPTDVATDAATPAAEDTAAATETPAE